MKRNMKAWLKELPKTKKALPILSFPCVSLQNISVKELIADSDLQAQGMQLIASRTDSAAAISFMDLSVEAECFGSTIRFSDSEVPTVIGAVITDEDEANDLAVPEIGSGRTNIYIDAIKKASKLITDRPVLAGMIGPFSLAARLLDVSEIMMDCYDEPDMVHTVLEKVTQFLIEYAKAYKNAGANGIMLAEPVSGLLSPMLEEEFSSPYVKRIVDAVQDDEFILIYHNCGDNTPAMVPSMLSTGSAAYHFGNSIDLSEMIKKFPSDVPIMGNVDPAGILRMGTPSIVYDETKSILSKCAQYPNFVISSGCDIPPMTPWDNLDAFFNSIKDFYSDDPIASLAEQAKNAGATNAKVISADKIETDTAFRDMCKSNSCGQYGKCWMCPPDIGEINELIGSVSNYKYALVYQFIGELEDSYDYDGMVEAKKHIYNLSQTIREMFDKIDTSSVLHLGAGGCGVCEVCAKRTDEPCRYPEKAMPSLEAYGINVSRLATVSDMKYINGANTVTYFGAVLFNL